MGRSFKQILIIKFWDFLCCAFFCVGTYSIVNNVCGCIKFKEFMKTIKYLKKIQIISWMNHNRTIVWLSAWTYKKNIDNTYEYSCFVCCILFEVGRYWIVCIFSYRHSIFDIRLWICDSRWFSIRDSRFAILDLQF